MHRNLPSLLPSFMHGGAAVGGHNPTQSGDTLSPQPVPENLCKLRSIVSEISYAVDQSPHLSIQVKNSFIECTHQLEAECSKLVDLTQLAHRAAENSSNVLLWRIRFFEALDKRINELSRLRSSFVESRKAFRAQPLNLLLEGIREAKGHTYEGMLSDLKPLFTKIETYYNEVNVSLRIEEDCLKKISSSLRVTRDDKLRWEYIRDACREAYNLLTSEPPPPPPPHMYQQVSNNNNNKAARHIKALAQTVTDARQSLLQSHQNISNLTQHPQFGLLRLQGEYESGEYTCRQRIREVHDFSESFLRAFMEVPPLDDFRDHLLPSAASSSSYILQEVCKQIQRNKYAVLGTLPQLKGHFLNLERCLPIADESMQRMYRTLHRLVQPLERPDDPHQGVLRRMKPMQLREEHDIWSRLEQKWAAAQLQNHHSAL